jgi:hypothetical protein
MKMVQPYCRLAIMAMQMTPATSCTHGLDPMFDGGGAMLAVVSAGDKRGFPSEEFEAISPPNENYGASRAAPLPGTGP